MSKVEVEDLMDLTLIPIDEPFDITETYLLKLDLLSSCWKILLANEAIPKTAFNTGKHGWLVMPFGLTGAPGTIPSIMNYTLPLHPPFIAAVLDLTLSLSERTSRRCLDVACFSGISFEHHAMRQFEANNQNNSNATPITPNRP